MFTLLYPPYFLSLVHIVPKPVKDATEHAKSFVLHLLHFHSLLQSSPLHFHKLLLKCYLPFHKKTQAVGVNYRNHKHRFRISTRSFAMFIWELLLIKVQSGYEELICVETRARLSLNSQACTEAEYYLDIRVLAENSA